MSNGNQDSVLNRAIRDEERLKMGKEALARVIKQYGLAMQVAMILKPPGMIEPVVSIILDPEFRPLNGG